MSSITIEGGIPLVGEIALSGAKNSALKIIIASLFCNENIVLENVPRIQSIYSDLEIISHLGGKAEWTGNNRLSINGSTLNSYEIPFDLGLNSRIAALFAAPLLFRFGKAIIPKAASKSPINRWIDTWKSFGIEVEEDSKYMKLAASNLKNATINFRTSSHMGTDNAILSSLFILGDTYISNAAEEPEVDDLISFCNVIGGKVERIEPRKIKVSGTALFKGGYFEIQSDRIEAAAYAVAAVLTKGNVTIKKVNRTHLTALVNAFTKIGCQYEFAKDEMRVWHAHEKLLAANITTAPTPGFITDWQPFITLLLTQATGDSTVHETIYTAGFDYIKDLNRMGAKIELYRPSEMKLQAIISDDSYDYKTLGEPYTVSKIIGPAHLKNAKIDIIDTRFGLALILAALCAEGKSEVSGFDNVEYGFEAVFDKLTGLGANLLRTS